MVVAHKSSSEEIGILRKVFEKYDSRRDGSISYEEFCEALRDFGHTDEALQDMFEAVVSSDLGFAIRVFCRVWKCLNMYYLSFGLGFGRLWTNPIHRISCGDY
jgi:hypothetical protein